MSRPVVALLTDFGLRDHYVGTMKAVVLAICPEATLVDISHDVPAHDVLSGALQLGAAFKYFPTGTIFLAVVDPGVGSTRRAIAAEAGGYFLVGPDNGVFSVVLDEVPIERVVELSDPRYWRAAVSRTFEGRDRFAPAAGWLAMGVPVSDLGRPAGPVQRIHVPRVQSVGQGLEGEVLWVDRFGNLVTNVDRTAWDRLATGPLAVEVAGRVIPFVSSYSEVSPGELCVLFGSTDRLEIAANGTSAAAKLSLERGAPVRVVPIA
jgi:S-adenosylmethionine hydrolase